MATRKKHETADRSGTKAQNLPVLQRVTTVDIRLVEGVGRVHRTRS